MGEGRDFVRIHRLREYLGWTDAHFSAVLERLRAAYTIELHGGDPSVLTPEERSACYEDPSGQVFITVSWRGEPA